MKVKLVAVTLFVLFGTLAVSVGSPPEGHGPEPSTGEIVARDIGGGGQLHSGTFHPIDSNIILVGSDQTGGIYRTDDFGENWAPWNEGLANHDLMQSMYVEDLIGIVEPGRSNDTVTFFAATHGGIYRRLDQKGETWDWMGDDQPREKRAVDPSDSLIYWRVKEGAKFTDKRYHREPISFSCLDWNGDNLLVAGAGRVRWAKLFYETDNYPGFPQEDLDSDCNSDLDRDFPCNDAIRPIWYYDLNNKDEGWQWLDISGLAVDHIGTPRDISITKIGGIDYLAVATNKGIYLYTFSGGEWHDLTGHTFWSGAVTTNPPPARPILYGEEMTAWSIHLTKRGTLYVAMQRLGGDYSSGVYRIRSIFDDPLELHPWVWVGDGEVVPPYDDYDMDSDGDPDHYSLWEIGLGEYSRYSFGQPGLVYLTVVDGVGEEADTLYLADRRGRYGLFKGEQPFDLTGGQYWSPGHWTTLVGSENWDDIYPSDFDEGWIDFWGLQVSFQPAVMPDSSPHKLAVQFNNRMHLSADGGSTWEQRYCEEDPLKDNAWTSRGYNELCVVGATFLADGRPVFSNADDGTLIGTDSEGSSYYKVRPEHDGEAKVTPDDDLIFNHESNDVEVLPEWSGDTESEMQNRDALFINYSDVVQKVSYGKLFMHLFDRNEGPSIHPEGEWFNITKSVAGGETNELVKYLYGDFVIKDHNTIFLSYMHYGGPVGDYADEDSDGTNDFARDGYGVLKGTYQDRWDTDTDGRSYPVWEWEDFSNNLPYTDSGATSASKLLYNSYDSDSDGITEDRIFLATTGAGAVNGGLYILEPADSDIWQAVINEESPTVGDINWRWFQDFRSMAQSQSGQTDAHHWLYVGTRGRGSGGIGALLRCKNPSLVIDSNGDSDLTQWEILANDPTVDYYPFNFHEHPPFFAADYYFWDDDYIIDPYLTHVSALAVDPLDREVVYLGLMDEEGMAFKEGLWRFDGNKAEEAEKWKHLSAGEPLEGMAIHALECNPYVEGQLLIGTDGQGLYIGEFGKD